jgi:hypothetical protein
MKYALIKNSLVENIIVADSDFISSIMGDYDSIIDVDEINAFIGQEYTDGQFIVPEVVVPIDPIVPPKTIFTKLEFRNRFTFAELVAIEESAVTDAGVRVLKDNLAIADHIDITRADTIGGVNYLVSKNLLTQERSVEILTVA